MERKTRKEWVNLKRKGRREREGYNRSTAEINYYQNIINQRENSVHVEANNFLIFCPLPTRSDALVHVGFTVAFFFALYGTHQLKQKNDCGLEKRQEPPVLKNESRASFRRRRHPFLPPHTHRKYTHPHKQMRNF